MSTKRFHITVSIDPSWIKDGFKLDAPSLQETVKDAIHNSLPYAYGHEIFVSVSEQEPVLKEELDLKIEPTPSKESACDRFMWESEAWDCCVSNGVSEFLRALARELCITDADGVQDGSLGVPALLDTISREAVRAHLINELADKLERLGLSKT